VLFADVVGSLAIASAVGAERLREIMADVYGRAATSTRRYGGTVNQVTGDGIMAVFGAPVALEDHAFRACLAALDIQEQMAQLAGEVQRHDGVVLRLRVGLNSGRVIAGEIGSGPTGYTAVGEQVGLAQRMESVALPGGVLLTESTARLVDHTTVLGAREWVYVNGAEEPLPARRLLGVAADRGRPRPKPVLDHLVPSTPSLPGLLRIARGRAGNLAFCSCPPVAKTTTYEGLKTSFGDGTAI
jgi:class 3 adenylate cyclase